MLFETGNYRRKYEIKRKLIRVITSCCRKKLRQIRHIYKIYPKNVYEKTRNFFIEVKISLSKNTPRNVDCFLVTKNCFS